MPAPTGLIFVDTFDHYNNLTLMNRKWTIPGGSALVTGRGGVGQAIQCSAITQSPWLTFGWIYPTITCGFAYQSQGFANSVIEYNCQGKNCALLNVGDGRLQIGVNNTNFTGPFNGFVMNLGIWYFVEYKITVTTNLFTYEVRVNNNTIATGTLASATNLPLGVTQVRLSNIGSLTDDLSITDGDFLGDTHWICIYTNAPGDSTQWTPHPGVANWINTSEHSPDDFTSYNEAGTIGNQDLCNMDDLGGTFKIVGVHALNCMSKSAAGVSSIKGSVKTNATLIQDPDEFFPSFGSWQYQRKGYEINPVTGLAWTSAEINAIQRGALRIS